MKQTTMNQGGHHNRQAGGDMYEYHHHYYYLPDFNVIHFGSLIEEMYDHFVKEVGTEDLIFTQMNLEEKNRLNELETYFNQIMKEDIVYFSSLRDFVANADSEFIEKFNLVAKSIKRLVLEDGDEKLTPSKINRIVRHIDTQGWNIQKTNNAYILVHYLYFRCLIGEKND